MLKSKLERIERKFEESNNSSTRTILLQRFVRILFNIIFWFLLREKETYISDLMESVNKDSECTILEKQDNYVLVEWRIFSSTIDYKKENVNPFSMYVHIHYNDEGWVKRMKVE